MIFIVALFGVVVLGAVAHVGVRLKVIHAGYALGQAEEARDRLEEEHRKLLIQVAQLRSPERIEKIARDQLGMVHPDPSKIRVIHGGSAELAAR
jgi:cell division protein FtsL